MYNPDLHFHFTGIGGVGMSGIAEILLGLGFKVSGSDLNRNQACIRLEEQGAAVFRGHHRDNVPAEASLVVYTSAVRADNPELLEAKERGLPVIRRAEVLAELMRLKYGIGVAGSHGKTTTTSLIAHILEGAKFDPTVIIGGQIKSMGERGGKLGKGDFLVAETDESDRSFLLLTPTIAVVTNIDNEHIEAYDSMAHIEESFKAYIHAVPFYGLAVLCIDDPRVRGLALGYTRRQLTYGFSPDAHLTATDLQRIKGGSVFNLVYHKKTLGSVTLPVPGNHMVLNTLAAIGVALELGIEPQVIISTLQTFKGVRRRLEQVGVVNGITVISDYGHHPTEIKATLDAIRAGWGEDIKKLHVVFQPHRFSRTKQAFADFLTCFEKADNLILTDIYAASEEPVEGVTAEILFNAIDHPSKHFVHTPEDALPGLVKNLSPGDFVLTLGAGSIGTVAPKLVEQLKSIYE